MAMMNRNQLEYLKSILEDDKKYTFVLREGAPEFTGSIRLEDIYQVKQGRKVIYDATLWSKAPMLRLVVEYVPGECEVNLVQGIKKNHRAPRHSLWCYNGQAVTREFTPAKYYIEVRAEDGSCVRNDFYQTVKWCMNGSRLTAKRRKMLELTLYRIVDSLTEMPDLMRLVREAVSESGI